MAHEEPKIRIESREELIYLLAEAEAIEHNLMCCYLYAAWSLKRGERDGLTRHQAEAVSRWKRAITSVAIEEMTHLALAANLTTAIGGAPHFSRPNFPIPAGYHPSGVVVELARFSPAVLDHFIFLERPEGKELTDSTEFVHPADYHRTQPKGRLMPHAQDYATVGHLYRGIRHGFEVLAHHIGERALFCGGAERQITPAEVSLPGITAITDLASARAAIETIIDQGEGSPGHNEDSHFNRFLRVRREYDEFVQGDPAFEPAFPVAHNPVMRRPRDPVQRVFIEDAHAASVLDLANAAYGHALRCLTQAYGRAADDTAIRRTFADAAIDLMFVLTEIGPYLASLPAGSGHPGINAGMTFTTLRDLAKLPPGPSETRIISERFLEMAKHARHVFPAGHELAGLADTLLRIGAKFGAGDVKTVATATSEPAAAATTAPPAAGPTTGPGATTPSPAHTGEVPPTATATAVETAEGKDVVVTFDGRRCIHSRNCVLGAPQVFRANTPGAWIHPDAMPADAVVRIAYACPSGAIHYRRKDGGPAEQAPPVNTLSVRENGPYAIHAEIKFGDADVGFRATLCRCGASKRKPFCDGSHNTIGFKASGEPDSRQSTPLAVRDGPLTIEPQRNGPLQISGNVEICTGTGRTIDRVTRARLCRCGHSSTKPFCDNTHLKVGFEADGV
ncbi:MAG TPA: ferritin-like domain-containing protein [Bauldia sp.]|nr:ferritin-like domain-containing protein [Bauldia sp.]